MTHLTGVETLTRHLLGGVALSVEQYEEVGNHQPYGVMSAAERSCDDDNVWRRIRPPVPPTCFGSFISYDWTYLLTL